MDFRAILFGVFATVAGYYMWRNGARARSLIRGTATSKIATAPKGYVELSGTVRAPTSAPLRDPITDQPCLWFSIVTEKFSYLDKMRWKVVKTAHSSRPFVLDDGTARCLLSPGDADLDEGDPSIIVKERFNLRHKVWWIRDGDPVYAIGHLQRTSGLAMATRFKGQSDGAAPDPNDGDQQQLLNERTSVVLKAWKRDQNQLITTFDADGDGRIDSTEWEAARTAAREQAKRELAKRPPVRIPILAAGAATAGAAGAAAAGAAGGWAATASRRESDAAQGEVVATGITHRLLKPDDGRPFLVSKYGEKKLASRNLRHSFGGMGLFLAGVITLLVLLKECVG